MPVLYRKSRLLRRSRVLWGSLALWRPRLIFWFGAFAIGVISVGFARLADLAQRAFAGVTTSGEWSFLLPLVITPLGFMLSATLAATFFPNAQGSGIPQAIAARHLRDPEDRTRLLSLRLVFGKIVLTVLGLLSGASIGREGPTVQVGASIMLAVARFGGMAQARGLILAGSAAGIAAAFNTPLAGIVFAIEEMSRTYESRANGLVLTAVILSGLAALGLAGSYNYFGSTAVAPASLRDWELVFVCGIGGGALGAAFSGLALHIGQHVRRFTHSQPLRRMVMLATACGLAVAVIGILSDGTTFGTGYDQAKGAVEGNPLPLLFFLEKLAAGFLSMISGIPGGIFAPSLAIGAGFGSTVGQLMGSGIALAAILGMAGYFSGVVQAPMTAFVIILEMTGDHQAVIPIMAVSMIGYVTSRLLSREPLYHGLSRVFIAAAIRARRARELAES
ncbi:MULTISPECIES: chloride channel protein [unclassified Rhizobium]|uniref:chloride channel protein n=1 Tax=unclassified Rhizobium TaxID=2613769 RepID=UPI001A98426A|nr:MULTISPECIES: chloride channel protein [unclassified Rhizobium]MBX5157079.1 chloride channel protein [Rhizobium sp. NZLR8]MBX5165163.1 chloride channel protein [Rhizobium sp. NZLR4b]MBX5189140.1 chloride channel protein [Rhizobium sp. NZLR3b]MBX5195498.1 chloride channel protein [Rhizobium sp. NZLR10]MBX5205662.1 chloride channel protein [Rhizobium sp. NZLR1]